ncbi:uncharacterized protein N7458_003270 [Penicillium daleae]|uniref:Uncharacterized protein n=1 Tax=Penicillium daleae TaxID=63821 RepID=A0AAD6CG66_9EURO|nr:uncharacterized protein N7458_003270 [Penicillium daleae]KAJ5461718.1 hypothetical protein N7458_003270 [Penicillium daleae]
MTVGQFKARDGDAIWEEQHTGPLEIHFSYLLCIAIAGALILSAPYEGLRHIMLIMAVHEDLAISGQC